MSLRDDFAALRAVLDCAFMEQCSNSNDAAALERIERRIDVLETVVADYRRNGHLSPATRQLLEESGG